MWGWQPALYLFLGGLGGGTFAIAGMLFLLDQKNHRRLLRWALVGAAGSLILGVALLIGDLIHPMRGLLLWESFSNARSPMVWGVWIIASNLLLMVLCFLRLRRIRSRNALYLLKTLMALGILCGLCLGTYTGVLLMQAQGVPFWQSAFLPCLFAFSSLGSGIAFVELLSLIMPAQNQLKPRAIRLLARGAILITILETLTLVLYLGTVSMMPGENAAPQAMNASAHMLIEGSLSQPFWILVVLVGLALPLLSAFLRLRTQGAGRIVFTWLGPIATLVGACELRYLILAAGVHMNLIASALSSFIS